MKKLTIALACSPGGHLTQMLRLKNLYSAYGHFFYTFRREFSEELEREEDVVYVVDSKRNPLLMLVNFFQALFISLRRHPEIVIANGGGFVVPFCWWAKIFGAKIIFMESMSRVDSPSISGKLVHPIADLFIVQWESLMKFYPKAVYGGHII